MHPVEAVAPRRAALLIHALPDAARSQVLAQLSDEQRAAVQALLAELRAMGIPQDRDWLSLAEQGRGGAGALFRQVDALAVADVSRALGGQPLATMAAVLGLREWTWRESVLAALAVDQRIRLNALLKEGVVLKDAMAQALLKHLLAQVGRSGLPAQDSPGERPRRPARAGSWLSRFFR